MKIKAVVFVVGMVNTENEYNETVYNACVFADSKSDAKKAVKAVFENDVVFRLEKIKVDIDVSTIYTTITDEIVAFVERETGVKIIYSVVDDNEDYITDVYEHTVDTVKKQADE